MPASVVSPQSQRLDLYDVVGEGSFKIPHFVQHVALHQGGARDLVFGEAVEVVHMGPPLRGHDRLTPNAMGRVPLDSEELKRIETWIEKVVDEYHVVNANARRQYVIDPPWEDVPDPNTGVRRYRRYSCAGFVLDAHRQVDIELLDRRSASLPEVAAETIQVSYPGLRTNRLAEFGLRGNGPWRIVLAGYVLHSLNRTTEEIRQRPYEAQVGDECFS